MHFKGQGAAGIPRALLFYIKYFSMKIKFTIDGKEIVRTIYKDIPKSDLTKSTMNIAVFMRPPNPEMLSIFVWNDPFIYISEYKDTIGIEFNGIILFGDWYEYPAAENAYLALVEKYPNIDIQYFLNIKDFDKSKYFAEL